MKIGKVSNITLHLFGLVEILVVVLMPIALIDKGFSPLYSILAGWTFGFLTPSIAVQHEWVHDTDKKWYTGSIFCLQQILFYFSNIVLHHTSHHIHANTLKDYGHPKKDGNVLYYVYSYMLRPIPHYLKKEPKTFIIMNLLSIIATASIYYMYGAVGLCFQIGCLFGYHYTLFVGNYIQHYGLETLPVSDKEKVLYAWDDTSPLSEYLSFNLTVHSDHHTNAKKPFNELRHIKGQPVVPYGFPLLMLLFPTRLFKKAMNKRLASYLERFGR